MLQHDRTSDATSSSQFAPGEPNQEIQGYCALNLPRLTGLCLSHPHALEPLPLAAEWALRLTVLPRLSPGLPVHWPIFCRPGPGRPFFCLSI